MNGILCPKGMLQQLPPLAAHTPSLALSPPTPPHTERLRAKAAAVAADSFEVAALQKQVAQQERELARQAAELARDAAEVDVRAREAAKQLGQVSWVGRKTAREEVTCCGGLPRPRHWQLPADACGACMGSDALHVWRTAVCWQPMPLELRLLSSFI